jgi:hypothetical protein
MHFQEAVARFEHRGVAVFHRLKFAVVAIGPALVTLIATLALASSTTTTTATPTCTLTALAPAVTTPTPTGASAPAVAATLLAATTAVTSSSSLFPHRFTFRRVRH